ncbi:hypothetical protein, partial [Salmonella enterica]|uniref:hypothetical protein n=1 Tax=Salmonella enterica TaxID=28901 RepID=UPI00288DE0D2
WAGLFYLFISSACRTRILPAGGYSKSDWGCFSLARCFSLALSFWFGHFAAARRNRFPEIPLNII